VTHPAILALEDGTVFEGDSVGADGLAVGEVVFNTAMTGYQEIVTDPSYARQIVTLTYPHIGNTGCNAADDESTRAWAAGLIVRDVPRRPSSWRSESALPDWLRQRNVVAISGIDTRKLTRLLRDRGAQNGALVAGERIDVDAAIEAARKFPGLKGMDLAKEVSVRDAYRWNAGQLDLDRNEFAHGGGRHRVVAYHHPRVDAGRSSDGRKFRQRRRRNLHLVADAADGDHHARPRAFGDVALEERDHRAATFRSRACVR